MSWLKKTLKKQQKISLTILIQIIWLKCLKAQLFIAMKTRKSLESSSDSVLLKKMSVNETT